MFDNENHIYRLNRTPQYVMLGHLKGHIFSKRFYQHAKKIQRIHIRNIIDGLGR